jgi:hypothetical protein
MISVVLSESKSFRDSTRPLILSPSWNTGTMIENSIEFKNPFLLTEGIPFRECELYKR